MAKVKHIQCEVLPAKLDTNAIYFVRGEQKIVQTDSAGVPVAFGILFSPQKAGLRRSGMKLIKNRFNRIQFRYIDFDNNGLVKPDKTGFKIKEDGLYLVNGFATARYIEDGKTMVARMYINGRGKYLFGRGTSGYKDYYSVGGSVLVNLKKDDVVEMFVYHNNRDDVRAAIIWGYNYFQIFKIGNI